jgi:hypothetical protein
MTVQVYGASATGKTTLASTFPKPILILGAEDGTSSISDVDGVEIARLHKSVDFRHLIRLVGKSGAYQTLVLDSATSLMSICLAEIMRMDEIPTQLSWGFASQDDYGQAGLQVKEIMRDMTRLADSGHCHAVVLGQERSFGKGSGSGDDVMDPKVMMALGKSAAAWANAEFDYILRMYVRPKTEEVLTEYEVNGRKKQKWETRETGDFEHVAMSKKNDRYVVKFRIPIGRFLPDAIPDPTYDKIRSVIDGTFADQ